VAGEVSFMPTADDYLAANKDWSSQTFRKPRTIVALAAVTVVAALLGGLSSPLDGDPYPIFRAIGFGFSGLAIMAIGYLASWLVLPRQVRRLYGQQKSLQRTWRYAWSDEGLEFTSTHGTAKLPWVDLRRWSIGSRTFLFFASDRVFYFIPFHVLDEWQAEDLRSTASRCGPPPF
jgi:hypothetical protein